eukprot:1160356-Pelagomonas_calceolata.AAC.2
MGAKQPQPAPAAYPLHLTPPSLHLPAEHLNTEFNSKIQGSQGVRRPNGCAGRPKAFEAAVGLVKSFHAWARPQAQ